jgi:hypothetical protein
VRATLSGESVHINCRIGLSGYNLTCDGLLLGMRHEGHKEFSDEASPHALTLADTLIINTPMLIILQERVTSPDDGAPARSVVQSTSTQAKVLNVIKRSRRRAQVTRGLLDEANPTDDTRQATIGWHKNSCKHQRTIITP